MIHRLKPIGTPGHLLGTDELGRDMLSRLIYGARLSLLMGVTPVPIAFLIGSAIGIVAGYRRRLRQHRHHAHDRRLLRLPLGAAGGSILRRALGSGLTNALVSLTVVFIPPIARVAESVTTQVRAPGLCRRGPRLGCGHPHDHRRPCPRQRAGPDFRLRHEPHLGRR